MIIYGLPCIGKTHKVISELKELKKISSMGSFTRINCIFYNGPLVLVKKLSEIFQTIIKDSDFKPASKVRIAQIN